ncbi:hypothetical protein HDU81_005283 [Chytriomyces hyalinus]|nr:hypothetical protein HDU81_005283 [Chytriomyces hyalinus]
MSSNDIFSMVENDEAGKSGEEEEGKVEEEKRPPQLLQSLTKACSEPRPLRKRVESSHGVNKQHGGSLFITSHGEVTHLQRSSTAESHKSIPLTRDISLSITREPRLDDDTISNEAVCGSIKTIDEEEGATTAAEIIAKEPPSPTQLDRRGFSLYKQSSPKVLLVDIPKQNLVTGVGAKPRVSTASEQTEHSRVGYRSADISSASIRSVESAKHDANTIKEEDETSSGAVEKPKKSFLSQLLKSTTINRYKASGSLATVFEDCSFAMLGEAKSSQQKRARMSRGISRYSIASATWEFIMAGEDYLFLGSHLN